MFSNFICPEPKFPVSKLPTCFVKINFNMVPPFIHISQVFHFLQVWPRSSELKVKVTLEQTTKFQRERRDMALLFL